MKLTYIIDSLRLHGTQRFLSHLVDGLSTRGYVQQVLVLNQAVDPGLRSSLYASGAEITVIGKTAIAGGWGVLRLAALLRQRRPDIALSLLPVADVVGRWAARQARVPHCLSSIRARNVDKPSWMKRIDRWTTPWMERVVFNSREVIPYACMHEGVRPEQAVYIPNGVPDLLDRARAARADQRKALGLGPDHLLIGSMGRLYPQKNTAQLLHVLERLPGALPWSAVIIGEGPERPRLEALARGKGLAERVRFVGGQADVVPWLGALDVLAHPALFEGLPNSLLEAMSAGVPVVASAVDGNRELVVDGDTGWLADPENTDEFAAALTDALAHPGLRETRSNAARQQILAHYSLAGMCDAYDRLFRSLV